MYWCWFLYSLLVIMIFAYAKAHARSHKISIKQFKQWFQAVIATIYTSKMIFKKVLSFSLFGVFFSSNNWCEEKHIAIGTDWQILFECKSFFARWFEFQILWMHCGHSIAFNFDAHNTTTKTGQQVVNWNLIGIENHYDCDKTTMRREWEKKKKRNWQKRRK